jgi:arginine N-succinyltransferase
MYIVRPALTKDLEDLYELALKSSLGLTNFPKDQELLSQMLLQTTSAFEAAIREPGDELYIFCLERMSDHKVVGSSMIRANVPNNVPLPYFLRYPQRNWDMLQSTFDKEGASELCGLYIDPDTRREGLGKLISVSRFFYIADHLKRFMNKIFADIHGYVDSEGNCPFWEGVMRPFFKMPFKEAVIFYIKDLAGFNEKIPTFPIYFDLLPEKSKKFIGTVHPKSQPALKLLEHQGIFLTDLIHPLDGGPRVEGYVGEIQGIQHSEVLKISSIGEAKGPLYLLATTGRNFRATIGPLSVENGEALISYHTANNLDIEEGELCRTLPLH